MKKISLAIAFSIFIFSFSQSQVSDSKKKEDFDITKFKTREIDIPVSKNSVPLISIDSIQVVDARPDTVNVGLTLKSFHRPAFIVLKHGVKNSVERFLTSYASSHKKNEKTILIVVLKKLWLTGDLDPADNRKYLNDKVSKYETPKKAVVAKLEFYLHEESDYFPLYRFDSTLYQQETPPESGSELIQNVLMLSLAKMQSIDKSLRSSLTAKRKLNWEQIRKYNEDVYDVAILKDTLLNRGVYMSFDEFKKNTPSITEFEIKKEKEYDALYVRDANGTEVGIRNVWGYCDGKDIYIRQHNNYSLLQRLGNALYIYGVKDVLHVQTPSASPTPSYGYPGGAPTYSPNWGAGGERIVAELMPYQLDWDTGKLN